MTEHYINDTSPIAYIPNSYTTRSYSDSNFRLGTTSSTAYIPDLGATSSTAYIPDLGTTSSSTVYIPDPYPIVYPYFSSNSNVYFEKEKFDKILLLKKNLIISRKSRAINWGAIPENEQIALETLREMITEFEFRKYIKYGFILVSGHDGKTYQIFRNNWHIKVWKKGQLLEEICVRIKSKSIPPTDNVIAFMNIIKASEEEFKKLGNVYKMKEAA